MVYLARDLKLGRKVAIKILLHAGDEMLANRFEDEARAVAQLQHPNIAQLFEFHLEFEHPCIVMEFVDGGTLASQIDGRPVVPRAAAKIVAALARAIEHAHRKGIIHRDLKPGNILLSDVSESRQTNPNAQSADSGMDGRRSPIPGTPANGNTGATVLDESFDVGRLRVADFGLARNMALDRRLTLTGDVLGTPEYMSPEQATGITTRIGPASDIYSLGIILYELMTGRPPFAGADGIQTVMMLLTEEPLAPRALVPRLPLDLQTICLKCLEKKPARRYSTAQELADDLGNFLRGDPIRARPVSSLGRIIKWSRRKPWQAAALSLLATSILGAVIGLIVLQSANRKINLANSQLNGLNTSLVEATRQAEEAYRLSQNGLQGIVGKIRDELYDIPQTRELTLEVVRESSELNRRLARIRPDDLETSRNLAQSLQIQRMSEWLAGNRNESKVVLLELSELLNQVCQQFPDQLDLRAQQLKVWTEMADDSESGTPADRESLNGKIDRELKDLLANHNNDPAVQKVASELAKRQLDLAADKGDLTQVLHFAEQQLVHARRYATTATPLDRETATAWLIQAQIRLARYQLLNTQVVQAGELLDEADELFQGLPGERKSQRISRDLEFSLAERHAELAFVLGDGDRAVSEYSRAANGYRQLVQDFPGDLSWQTTLAGVLFQLARLAIVNEKYADARQHLDEAAALTGKVLEQLPNDWLANDFATKIERLRASIQ